jgi:hypothetical protein
VFEMQRKSRKKQRARVRRSRCANMAYRAWHGKAANVKMCKQNLRQEH